MKKDQFVIACLPDPSAADTVLPYARQFAARLGKGLIALNVSADGENQWIAQYGVPYAGLKGDWKTAIDGLPTAFGGVVAVTTVDPTAPRSSLANPATMLKAFADCKIAFIALPAKGCQLPTCTYLTLDHRRESKEKLIWGSYMVRFFGSQLTVAIPDYRDEGLRAKVHNNILFMKKVYKSLDVNYSLHTFQYSLLASRTSPDGVLLSQMTNAGTTMLIAMTTDRRDRDVGDWLLGPPERRLLAAGCPVPILFLNQRDDLYVLCD